jgi:hypothetical protein
MIFKVYGCLEKLTFRFYMERLRTLSKLAKLSDVGVDSQVLSQKINRTHRNSVLKWLFESLDLLKVEDSVFFATVSLSDRYCSHASLSRRLEGADLQLVILASLCCCLKVIDSSVDLSVKAFLEHVSGGHVDAKEIFKAEARILKVINFDAFLPSMPEYISGFYDILFSDMKCSEGPLEQPVRRHILPASMVQRRDMATFLLYLFSLDIDRLHSSHQTALVSNCILASSWIIDGEGCGEPMDVTVSVDSVARKLEEIGWIDARMNVAAAIDETVSFWEACLRKPSEASQSIFRIFSSPSRSRVSTLAPVASRMIVGGG